MSNRKKFFLAFVFIVLDVFLLIGFLEIRDATMLNNLKKEMGRLSQFNLATDRFNFKIQTKGKYAIVEKAIKEYLDDTAVLLQDTMKLTNDSKFKNILSYDQYVENSPTFQNSITYLEEKKETYNHNIEELLDDLEEDTIKNYIRTKTDDDSLCDLYEELVLTDELKGDFQETYQLVEKSKNRVNHIIDTSLELLKFLSANQDSWVLEEGEIRFKTEALYQKYISYVNQVK